MSKELEALEKGFWKLTHKGNINFYNVVEKGLRALEIIKEKKVYIPLLKFELDTYNSLRNKNDQLTQEEYDLLKEVLL